MKPISRRQFIVSLVGLAGIALVGRQIALASSLGNKSLPGGNSSLLVLEKPKSGKQVRDGINTQPQEGARFAMVIDVGACIGCRRCQYGCKTENNIPDTISPPWIEVFELDRKVDLTGHPSTEELKKGATTSYVESPRDGKWYLATQCNHCEHPACVAVCPTGATYKDKRDGLVLMDYNKCVGCRFCVVACPYNARRFNWSEPKLNEKDINPLVPVRPVGVVEKCTFCVHRVREGRLTRCVEVCPVGARHFGNLNDPESEVSKLLRSNASIRLLEDLNTDPSIWYITRGEKYTR